MTDDELVLIPLFLKLHHLVMFAKLLRSLTTDDQHGEATWVLELRKKLSLKAETYRNAFTTYAL